MPLQLGHDFDIAVMLLIARVDTVCRLTTAAVQDGKWDEVRRNEVAVMDASMGEADIKVKTECGGAENGGQQDDDGEATACAEAKDDPFRLADILKTEQPEKCQQ
jgi:hypothetical protein